MTFTTDKPRAWFLFLAATGLGFLVFVPIAFAGLNLRGIPWFLTGLAGAGVSFIAAAFIGLFLASRVAAGEYRGLRPAPWRDQVWLALVALAAPLALLAPQAAQAQDTLTRGELRTCMDRDEALTLRQDRLAASKRDNDAEADAIARAGWRLARDLARLDPADTAGVEAHNARTAEHNRRVDEHNQRVADMNSEAARLNGDQAEMSATCGSHSYYPRDRDAILRERGSLR